MSLLTNIPSEDITSFQQALDKYDSLNDITLLTTDETLAIGNLMRNIGVKLRAENNHSEGLRYFMEMQSLLEEKGLKHVSMYPMTNFGIGSTLLSLNRLDEAEERINMFFEGYHGLPKDEMESIKLLKVDGYITRGQINFEKKKIYHALEDYTSAAGCFSELEVRIIMSYVDTLCKRLIEIFTLEDQAQKVVNTRQKNLDRAIELMYQRDSRIRSVCIELADYLRMADDNAKALEYAQSAYYITQKYQKEELLVPKRALELMQDIYFHQKDFKKCIEASLKMQEHLSKNSGLFPDSLMDSYKVALLAYDELNQIKEAKELFHRSEEVLSKLNAKDNNFMIEYYHQYAAILRNTRDSSNLAESKKYYKKALDLLTASEDPSKEDPMQAIFDAMNNRKNKIEKLHLLICIAQVATMENGSDQEAVKYFEEALEIASKKDPKTSKDLVDQLEGINAGLGMIYQRLKNYPKSIEHYLKTIELCKVNPTTNQRRLDHYQTKLTEVYWYNGEAEKAGDANRKVKEAPLREDVAAVVEELRKLNLFEDADKLEKFHRLKSK